MANRRFNQFFYSLHKYPVHLDCNFVVDSTNGNGLGIRSLNGPGIQAVYMHTSQTPAVGNPNPAAGLILVQFQDTYNYYYGGYSGFVAPINGTAIRTGMTVGEAYVITTVGNSTLAQWITAGLPAGITPAIGATFIAAATSIAGTTSRVEAVNTSGAFALEAVGEVNQTIKSSKATVQGVSSGAYGIFQVVGPGMFSGNGTTATDTTLTGLSSTAAIRVGDAVSGAGIPLGTKVSAIVSATALTLSAATTASATVPVTIGPISARQAPADGSVIGMSFLFSNSMIKVQGD